MTESGGTTPGRPLGGRLHVVTGKGGTGKTTVAAALALALAAGGRRVLLCEVEGRQGVAAAFEVPPLPYRERRIALGPDGGEVWALAIDAEEALLEYLALFYRMGRAGRALDRFGVTDFATTVAPGLRDVLLIGKVYEATRRGQGSRPAGDRPTYDAVVLDAPPTGRIGRFLNVNSEVAGIARVGPVQRQATSIMTMLRSATTRVHIVTTLEEMPVQEALDGAAEIRGIGLRLGLLVVNMRRTPLLPADALTAAAAHRLDSSRIEGGLASVGIEAGPALLTALADQAAEHADRVALEAGQSERLDDAATPVVSLPHLSEGIDVAALYDFADELRGTAEP